uniref:KRAB domain-containing protein n=1 Tax=Laticauda laticaudata TaxID=8630 RepID=A0A8C5SA52_LATLA
FIKTSSIRESLVSFEEVAVYFSEEEWSQLDPDEKALHSEVMLENHWNVVSLVFIKIPLIRYRLLGGRRKASSLLINHNVYITPL